MLWLCHDRYTHSEGDLTIENFDRTKHLGYVPEGYRIRYGDFMVGDTTLFYVNLDEEEIIFSYGIAEGVSRVVDNENREYINFIKDDVEYYYYKAKEDGDKSLFFWYEDGYYFEILARLSQDEFVQIAENVE